ncbi:TetR/AcrR family transcriptional regulator [Amycolatopsis sp. YIM 10]|uniref:TetR/AcrR family transcriptional regulator n=1 Tax=Amycolatopsis sp. YIM 10 TaxID=2653857 RepID=UPI001D155A3D|nr:TetR/AcrR family transcriptional regulator [Amycolatopsis sp. YIM 10]
MSGETRRRGRPSTGVRDAVLAATEAILAESGVARLSTKEIARRASVAESSIFYHFTDRLGLLQAVVHRHLPRYKEVAVQVRQRAGTGSLRDNLVDLLDGLDAFYERITPILAAVQADGELRALLADRGAGGEIGPQRALLPIAAYLTEERRLDRVRAGLDVDSTALLIVGAAHQRAVYRYLTGAGTALPSTGDIVDTLLPALLND